MPGPVDLVFPVLLDHPAPRILGYPVATVVAEKIEALVTLGMANTRFKDHYDVWMLARQADLGAEPLAEAVAATFRRRGTSLRDAEPAGLTPAFFDDGAHRDAWRAFLKRSGLVDAPEDFAEIGRMIRALALPALRAASIMGDPLPGRDQEEP